MDQIERYFQQENFAAISGVEITEITAGYAKAEMIIENRHLNVLGTVHGGALFTLADTAFAVASNAHGNVAVAINANMSFVKAVGEGHLYAEAKETSINPKISTYDVTIRNEEGDTIAIFTGMAYRKKYQLQYPEDRSILFS
ncbi:PaaI family thioesterase [Methanolobus sp. ZRKC3]|uniref:PaaI family thioesterase n=1 Tax=Methanolobus sp. ZRKC3 TaxID=3125786 RepID=UPI00324D0B0C